MDLRQDFAARVTAAERELPGPELLPERLARACAEVLPVDGAGVSLFFSADRRLPLGASDPVSATAERLQFTVGEGPCLTAHSTGRPVLADEAELHARWPGFADALAQRTAIRGVIALPLHGALEDIGALDLYVRSPGDIRGVSFADALTVVREMTDEFATAMAEQPHVESGPAWLDAPSASRRAQVWQAVGMVNVGLELSTADALALLRAYAYGNDDDLDGVAGGLVQGRLTLDELAMATGAGR